MKAQYFFLRFYFFLILFLFTFTVDLFAKQEGVFVTWEDARGSDKMIGTAVIDGETVTVTVTITSTPGEGYSGYFGNKEDNKVASIIKYVHTPGLIRYKGYVYKPSYNASGVEAVNQIFETDKVHDYLLGGYAAYQYPNVLTFTFSKPIKIVEFFVGDVDTAVRQNTCGLVWEGTYNSHYHDDSFTIEGADFSTVDKLGGFPNTATITNSSVLYQNPDEIYDSEDGAHNIKFKESKGNLESFVLKYRGAETKAPCTTSIASSSSNATNFYALKITNGCATEPPVIKSPQFFCKDGATVTDLINIVGISGVKWYDVPSGGTALPTATELISYKTYYASKVEGCESAKRTAVVVKVGPLSKPVIAKHDQIFCDSESPTIKDLKADGTNIKWYESETSMIDLPVDRALKNGKVYWAAQTAGSSCMSAERDSVKVHILKPVAGNILGQPYFCIGGTTSLTTDGTPGGTWSSDNESVATVDANTGLVTGLSKGSAKIYYTVGQGACLQKSFKEVFPLEQPEKPTFTIVDNPTCVQPSGSIKITNKEPNYSFEVFPQDPGVLIETYTGVAQGFRPGVNYFIYAYVGDSDCKSEASDTIRFSSDGLLDTPILKIIESGTCSNPLTKVKIENYNPTHDYVIAPSAGVIRKSNIITFPAGRTYIVKATTSSCSSGGASVEIPQVSGGPEKPILGDIVEPNCSVATGSFKIKNYSNTTDVAFTLSDLTTGSDVSFTPPADMVIRNLIPEHTYTVKAEKDGCSSVSDEVVIPKGTDSVEKPIIGNIIQPSCADSNAHITIVNFISGVDVLYEITNLSQGSQTKLNVDDKGEAVIPGPKSKSNYIIEVLKNGCKSPVSEQFTINAIVPKPDTPIGTIKTPISCESATAVIMITPQSGVEYSIDNVAWQDDNLFTGIVAGTYTLYVRNKNDKNCIAESDTPLKVKASAGVPEKPMPESVEQPDCGKPTGNITIVLQNEVEYSIDGTNWQTSNVFNDVSQGSYSLYVRSVNDTSCIAVSDTMVKIAPPAGVPEEPRAERVIQPDCGSTDGGTIVMVSQTNVEYSIDSVHWKSDNTFTNLDAKSYFLYVRNVTNKDCKVKSTKAVEILSSLGEAPPAPTIAGEPIQPTCGNPKGIITVTKQDGVEYSIDRNNWQQGTIFIGLSPGSYKIYARKSESSNCISESIKEVIIKQPDNIPTKPVVEGQPIQPTCEIPTGTIVIKTQPDVEYSIDGNNWQIENSISGLSPGDYFLYVRSTKDNSCISVSDNKVTINNGTGASQKPILKTVKQPTCSDSLGTIVIVEQDDVEYSLDGNNWQPGNSFTSIASKDYYLYVRSKTNKDCISKSDEVVTIKEAPTAPQKPKVKGTPIQPTCDNPLGQFEVEAGEAGLEYSIDNKIWQKELQFTKVSEGEYSLYVRRIESPDCIATADDKIAMVAPASAPKKPTINDVADDNKVNATERKKGLIITGVADAGELVGIDFGGKTKTVTVASSGIWTTTYTAGEFPNDGKISLTTKVEKSGCKNQDNRMIEVDTVVPGDSNGDGEPDKVGTPVVEITEDVDNDGYIGASELNGDIDYKIIFPKNSGYTVGDKLVVDLGQTYPLEIILTQDMIDSGYISKIPYILVENEDKITVKAYVVDNVGNKSFEGSDTAILSAKNPGDSDGDGKPDQAGSMKITIDEDVDNDGFITSAEASGAIDYSIEFPKNSGYEVGDILNITIKTGTDANTVSTTLTTDIIENGYKGTIANTFSKTTTIIVKGVVADKQGNSSLTSQDKAVVVLGAPGDSDGDGIPDDDGKPVVVITEDEDNNGFITPSELKGDINYTINFPKNSNYKIGDVLIITQSIGTPIEVTLTATLILKGYNGSIPVALIEDKDVVKVSAIVKDRWNSRSLAGEDTAILKKTSEAKDAPTIEIVEDADNDGYISAKELEGDVDYTVTFLSSGTYNVGDKLVITPSKGDLVVVELTDKIIKDGYKGILPSSLFKDGDILTVEVKITDNDGNESPVNTDRVNFAIKVLGDSDGDGSPDAQGSPIVVITEDDNDDGYINVAELNGEIDYIITLPHSSGYRVGDKMIISIGIVVPFKVKITEEILEKGYKGIVSSSWVKQGDTVKVTAKGINAKGDAESLEGKDTAILDKAVPGDSDKDGKPDKYGTPEIEITEDINNDGYINPSETKGDIDYSIKFPLERNYTEGDILIIVVNNHSPVEIELTKEMIKDGYKGTLPIKDFKGGDEILIKAKVKDPAGNESLEGEDSAILNTSDNKAPLVRIIEDVDNDGFINKKELQDDLDFRVLFPVKSNYKEGDKVLVTSNIGTTKELTLTEDLINNGYAGVIAKDKLPKSGEIVVKALLVGTKDEGQDKATIKVNEPGDSDGDGISDLKGAPIVVIVEDADNDSYIDKNELKDDINYTVELPKNSKYVVGDILLITPNVGDIEEVKVTQEILDKGYQGTVKANLFKDGDEVILKVKVEDIAHNTSQVGEDKAILTLTASAIPTVLKQQTDNVLPTIKGTAASNSLIEVTVNGIIYKENDGNLVDNGNDTWELTIPVGNELEEGTYDVLAKAKTASGKIFTDKTIDELIIDSDSDDDGIPDEIERGLDPSKPADTDGDGIPDYKDTDSDNDTIPDSIEAGEDGKNPVDTDNDGYPDYQDLDSDEDSVPDNVEAGIDGNKPNDSDGDGIADFREVDSDNDTIPDSVEVGVDANKPTDSDGDGVADFREIDSDGDTILDRIEVGADINNPTDTDNDGKADYQDLDSDGDTIPDSIEVGAKVENPVDTDADGIPDYQDLDSDGDRIKDNVEVGRFPENPVDSDSDGVADYRSKDSDSDGLIDTKECGPDFNSPLDTDGDGIENYRDSDSDNDGIADSFEFGKDLENLLDSDGDGVYDYLDLDSDNDSINDIIEAGHSDSDGNGMVDNAAVLSKDNLPDGDSDGIADYREIDSDNNGVFDIKQSREGDLSIDLDKDGVVDDKTDTDKDGILDPADGLKNKFGDASTTMPKLDAVDDERTVVYGDKMQPLLILGNDTKDGNIIKSVDEVEISIIKNKTNGALEVEFIDNQIIVKLTDSTIPNTYTLVYRIAQKLNPNNYDEATVTVIVRSKDLKAVDDDFSSEYIEQGKSNYNIGDVFANDLIGGVPIDRDAVILTMGEVTLDGKALSDPRVSINLLGIVSSTDGAKAGTYMLHYRICEKKFKDNCSEAVVKVVISTNCKKLIDNMEIPQHLSVNYDRINDTWELPELLIYHNDCEDKTISGASNKVILYNRWGMKVYEKENYMLDSERFEGFSVSSLDFADYEDMPSGVYFYIIQINGTHERTGYMYIINEKK